MNSEFKLATGRAQTVLRQGPFVRYMAGEASSMTGTWMQVMAQSWVMTTLTQSAVMFGLVNFCAGVPMIALSMVGGSWADRYDKRNILLVTQVVQIALALFLGIQVATGAVRIWHVLAVAVVLGVSNSFEMPAASSLVPELVAHDQVASAIAIDRSVFHATRLIGPALAGYAIGLWGPASAFYWNALSFGALIVALFTIRPRAAGSAAEEAQRASGMREGLAFVRADRPTLAMISLMALTTVFVFPILVIMLPLYARHALNLGPDSMGLLMGISATGSLTGSIGLLAVRREKRRALLMAGAIGGGGALVGLSLANRFVWAGLALVALSLSVSTMIGLANTIVQERAPSALRGRVSAIAGLSFFGLMPFAGLGITGVADWLGLRPALVMAGLGYWAGAFVVLAGFGRQAAEAPAGMPDAPVGETMNP